MHYPYSQFSGGCNLEDMENVKVYYYLCLQFNHCINMVFCVLPGGAKITLIQKDKMVR